MGAAGTLQGFGRHVAMGVLGSAARTKALITDDGWLDTGLMTSGAGHAD